MGSTYNKLGKTKIGFDYIQKALEVKGKNNQIRNKITRNIIEKYDMGELIESLKKDSIKTRNRLYLSLLVLLLSIVSFLAYQNHQKKVNKKKFDVLMQQLDKKNTTIETQQEVATQKPVVLDENAQIILKKLELFEEKKCTSTRVAN